MPIGRLAPERRTSAERLKAALRDNPADEGFADDLEAARAGLLMIAATAAAANRILLTTDGKAEFDQLAGVRSEVILLP